MFPGGFHAHPLAQHHHIDWSKLSEDDKWVLSCLLGGMLVFVCAMIVCLLWCDSDYTPAPVRQKIRRAFTAAEKAV
jgi:hypothetical protein